MQLCQDRHGAWRCLFFGTMESSNAPCPDPAGISPRHRGLTAEAVPLRSCSEELGRGLRHPCLTQRRKQPQGLCRGCSHANGGNSGSLPPLSSWPSCREKGRNPSALNAASVGFLLCCYVNHEIFLRMLANGLLLGKPHSWGGRGSSSLWAAPALSSLSPVTPI